MDGEGRLAIAGPDAAFHRDASHELRTPLTSVRGLAEYGLQQGGAARPELLRLMGLIAREASRMGQACNDRIEFGFR
jgi:two-component system OmpR family sensor kinase